MEKNNLTTIWKGCIAGDRKAQFRLYQIFSNKMFALCLRYSKDEDQAQDILQLGFIKVFKKAHLFNEQGSLEGWIRRIMVNTAIEAYRRNAVKFTEPLEQQHTEIAESLQTPDNLDYQDLLALIKMLPLSYRTVFNLYAIEGYSHREIAEMLTITQTNSKSQLSRARKWLKERLVQLERTQ
ncbi:MAG: RNA polymerase sigma factor [Sphingobacterium sp.]